MDARARRGQRRCEVNEGCPHGGRSQGSRADVKSQLTAGNQNQMIETGKARELRFFVCVRLTK
jgi:hypothetical protein